MTFLHKPSSKLVSPLLLESKILGINQWFPQINSNTSYDNIEVTARSAMFVETGSGRILYEKNPHEKLSIASLAKVMTATVAVENRPLDEVFTVSLKASEMEPDKMWLLPGEKFTLKDLLYGIFLISANDAAEVIAEGFGDREKFVMQMNGKALQLGMRNTGFVNPSGLDE